MIDCSPGGDAWATVVYRAYPTIVVHYVRRVALFVEGEFYGR